MLTIGIDIGVTGAIAILNELGQVFALHDLDITSAGSYKWADFEANWAWLDETLGEREDVRIYVEIVHAIQHMGLSTATSMGMMQGSVLALVQSLDLPFELVRPQKWKTALGLSKVRGVERKPAEIKAASMAFARRLFPKAKTLIARVRDHNRAEAMLIAHYGRRLYAQSKR